jgi:hypothetical protein
MIVVVIRILIRILIAFGFGFLLVKMYEETGEVCWDVRRGTTLPYPEAIYRTNGGGTGTSYAFVSGISWCGLFEKLLRLQYQYQYAQWDTNDHHRTPRENGWSRMRSRRPTS